MEEYNELEVEIMFDQVMSEIEIAVGKFEKTLCFRRLSYSEQKDAREIVLTFGEWLFDYHLEDMGAWSKNSIQNILISIFPHKISADITFFKKIKPILCSFLEFLYHSRMNQNGLKLSQAVNESIELMLNEVEVLLKGSAEKNLFSLGEEMGLDMSELSEIERLYAFVDLFRLPPKGKEETNIINLSEVKKHKNN